MFDPIQFAADIQLRSIQGEVEEYSKLGIPHLGSFHTIPHLDSFHTNSTEDLFIWAADTNHKIRLNQSRNSRKRKRIFLRHDFGYSNREIAKLENVSSRTVDRIVAQKPKLACPEV